MKPTLFVALSLFLSFFFGLNCLAQVTIQPTIKDATIVESSATGCTTNCKDDNFGRDSSLISSSISSHSKIIVGFPVFPPILLPTVEKVYLMLPKAISILGSATLLISGPSVSNAIEFEWREDTITWNKQPDDIQPIASIDVSIMRDTKLDITKYYLQHQNKEDVTLLLESEGKIVFPSKENSEYSQPIQLQIEFSGEKKNGPPLPKPPVNYPEKNTAFSSASILHYNISILVGVLILLLQTIVGIL